MPYNRKFTTYRWDFMVSAINFLLVTSRCYNLFASIWFGFAGLDILFLILKEEQLMCW